MQNVQNISLLCILCIHAALPRAAAHVKNARRMNVHKYIEKLYISVIFVYLYNFGKVSKVSPQPRTKNRETQKFKQLAA